MLLQRFVHQCDDIVIAALVQRLATQRKPSPSPAGFRVTSCAKVKIQKRATTNMGLTGKHGPVSAPKLEVPDQWEPRTWNYWTLSSANIELQKTNMTFQRARVGLLWLF